MINQDDFIAALRLYTEQAKEVSEALDEAFFESFYSKEGLICMQLNKVFFVDWNQALNDALGWSNKEIANIPWLDLVHPHDRLLATWVSQDGGLFYNQSKVNFFYMRYRHKDGSYKWLKFYREAYEYKGSWYTIGEDSTDSPEEQDFLETLAEVRNGRRND